MKTSRETHRFLVFVVHQGRRAYFTAAPAASTGSLEVAVDAATSGFDLGCLGSLLDEFEQGVGAIVRGELFRQRLLRRGLQQLVQHERWIHLRLDIDR